MGKCCCCNCLASCVFACICQVLCAIIVIFGIFLFAIWLIFRPSKIDFHVENASLSKFDFIPSTNTMDYDLALNVSIGNTNSRIGVHYDIIQARIMYHKQKFGNTTVEPFYQHPKNTTFLNPLIKGQSVVELDKSQKSNYDDETKSGVYKLYALINVHIRLKSGVITTGKFKLAAGCKMSLPLKSNATSSTAPFERTHCMIVPFASG